MTAITDILLSHHLTLNADDNSDDWVASCNCGADLGHCDDTWEGQKIQAAHVAHLIDGVTNGLNEAREASAKAHRGLRSLIARGVEQVARVEGPAGGHVDHSGDSQLIKFLADPGDGVFVDCLAGDSDLVRLTKTNSLDIPVGAGDANGRHGRTVESRQCLLHFERILRGDQGRGEPFPDADRVLHDDSSTGDGPAATGLTDRVEVAARQSGDSDSDGHADGDRVTAWLAELQRSVLDVLSWWDIVHGDPASDAAEGFLADAIAALRKEVWR